MKVGALIEPRLPGAAEFAVAAERLGADSVWTPEVSRGERLEHHPGEIYPLPCPTVRVPP